MFTLTFYALVITSLKICTCWGKLYPPAKYWIVSSKKQKVSLYPFVPKVPFWYPWKHHKIEGLCFQGDQKRNIWNERFIKKQLLQLLLKKMFLKISQSWQENTCAEVSFQESGTPRSAPFLKRDCNIGVFLWNSRNF